MIVMSKRPNFLLAGLSFLIGFALSSVLLHFLFGSSIYLRYSYRGLMAPSFYLLSIGYVSVFERVLSFLVDAAIFGSIIYLSIQVLGRFWVTVRR